MCSRNPVYPLPQDIYIYIYIYIHTYIHTHMSIKCNIRDDIRFFEKNEYLGLMSQFTDFYLTTNGT